MYRKTWVFILLSLALILALSACTRSASQPPAATATSESDFPFPLPTNNPLQNILSGTQTAMAKSGLPVDQSTPAAPGATQDVAVQPTDTSAAAPATATPAPTVPVATWVPTAGAVTQYTIQEGEYPFCLARRFNVDAGELLSANGLDMNSKPAAGTTIKIPSGGKAWAGDRARMAHPDTYTVEAGDTVYSIACDYGDVDPNAIITVNGLQAPYTLTTGQTLQIP